MLPCLLAGAWWSCLLMPCLPLLQVLGLRKLKPYIPDFKLAFEHFCIHTGRWAGSNRLRHLQPLPVACSCSRAWACGWPCGL